MDAPDGLPSEDLPFAVDNHSLNRWRTHTQSRREDHPQGFTTPQTFSPEYFEDFIAAEIARDKERGIATSPIAPSTVSDLSTVHKRLLRRHRKLWWACLAALQLSLGSTVAAAVFIVQDVKGFGLRPEHLIWLLLSLTAAGGSSVLLSTLYIRRRDRREKEKAFVKLEIGKYKRDMQRSQKEVHRTSLIGNRLEKEYRSASRAASLSSLPAHSEPRNKQAESIDLREAGHTYLDYRELYGTPGLEPETASLTRMVHDQSSQARPMISRRNHRQGVQLHSEGERPPVPPKDMAYWKRKASDSAPTRETFGEFRHSSLGRYVIDEIHPRRSEGFPVNALRQDDDVVRAGHGDGGSSQSDENFRQMHQLDSDAVSDDSRLTELRRGRSRERVEPWQERQTKQQKLENPHTPVRAPKLERSDDGKGPITGKGIKSKMRSWMKRQAGRAHSLRQAESQEGPFGVQHLRPNVEAARPFSLLDVTYRRPRSLRRRSTRSSSAPVYSGQARMLGKEIGV